MSVNLIQEFKLSYAYLVKENMILGKAFSTSHEMALHIKYNG